MFSSFICVLPFLSFSLIFSSYFNFSIILGCSRPGRAAGCPGSPSPPIPARGGWAPLVHGWVWGCIDTPPPPSIPHVYSDGRYFGAAGGSPIGSQPGDDVISAQSGGAKHLFHAPPPPQPRVPTGASRIGGGSKGDPSKRRFPRVGPARGGAGDRWVPSAGTGSVTAMGGTFVGRLGMSWGGRGCRGHPSPETTLSTAGGWERAWGTPYPLTPSLGSPWGPGSAEASRDTPTFLLVQPGMQMGPTRPLQKGFSISPIRV